MLVQAVTFISKPHVIFNTHLHTKRGKEEAWQHFQQKKHPKGKAHQNGGCSFAGWLLESPRVDSHRSRAQRLSFAKRPSIYDMAIWRFPKMGIHNSWLIYNGNSH